MGFLEGVGLNTHPVPVISLRQLGSYRRLSTIFNSVAVNTDRFLGEDLAIVLEGTVS